MTRSAPPAAALRISEPPTLATCVCPARSAATPCALAIDWMSASMPFFANVPSSAAIQRGRKSAIGLLYEITSLTGAAVGVAAASEAAGAGAVDPPQARTIERSVGTRERRITRPPLERAHP